MLKNCFLSLEDVRYLLSLVESQPEKIRVDIGDDGDVKTVDGLTLAKLPHIDNIEVVKQLMYSVGYYSDGYNFSKSYMYFYNATIAIEKHNLVNKFDTWKKESTTRKIYVVIVPKDDATPRVIFRNYNDLKKIIAHEAYDVYVLSKVHADYASNLYKHIDNASFTSCTVAGVAGDCLIQSVLSFNDNKWGDE